MMENHLTVAIDQVIYQLFKESSERKESLCHDRLGMNHLLSALLEIESELMWELLGDEVKTSLEINIKECINRGETGTHLEIEETVSNVRIRAFKRGADKATKRDLACVALAASGFDLKSKAVVEHSVVTPTPIIAPLPKKKPSIPTLLQYGVDLTRQAREGKLLPVVGRDEEIQLIIETLCRRTKRNPVLIGAAGVGKTAIVEGFAQRIVQGDVPDLLADTILIMLQPSLIVSGGGSYGELEKRMNPILAEATKDGVILFIDELHSIVGAGGAVGTSDIASILKPALARGDIACIAATTDNEYRRYIEPDTALERRFQPIRVQEMNTSQVIMVLQVLKEELKRSRGVDVDDEVLTRLVDYAEKYMRNRTFPDKAVDLLEQCVANALARGDRDVDVSEADTVVQRMIGIPFDISSRILAMRQTLTERRLLSEADRDTLAGRLQVTMRGLDFRMERPNAIILLAGETAKYGQALAEAISGALFNSSERIVKINLGKCNTHHDITQLLGSSPGFVGYGEALPVHRINQYSWCVVLFDNVDSCDKSIQQVIGQALADGYFVDGQSRKIYLSEVVVVLTASGIERKGSRMMGFHADSLETNVDRALLMGYLDTSIADAIDIVCFDMGEKNAEWSEWLRSGILGELTKRFSKHGVQLQWDDSIFDWIETHCSDFSCQRELEKLIDEKLSPTIYTKSKEMQGKRDVLIVRSVGNKILVDASVALLTPL